MDSTDRREARREREAAEALGKPEPRLDRWELKREQQQREAEALTTPASKAEVSKLSQAVTQLKAKLHAQGRRAAEQGMGRRRESPEEYARAYGGVRYRSGAASSEARTDGRGALGLRSLRGLRGRLGHHCDAYSYSAFAGGRQPKAISVISGTGLILPAL